MQRKICALIKAANPESEFVQALQHSDQRQPCGQIVGRLLTKRIRDTQKAARNAASVATRKHGHGVMEKYGMHQLIWDLLSRIYFLLQEAELPPDDAITDFAGETMFTQIYNIAQYADAFTDIALKACTLAQRGSINDGFDGSSRTRRPVKRDATLRP